MHKRTPRRNGLEVSVLGLGRMGMSFGGGPPAGEKKMVGLIGVAKRGRRPQDRQRIPR